MNEKDLLSTLGLIHEGLSSQKTKISWDTIDKDLLQKAVTAYVSGGVKGILDDINWRKNFDQDDVILRMEVVRLRRAGFSEKWLSSLFSIAPETILQMEKDFANKGVLGLLSPEDLEKAKTSPQIRICSFNLHGPHDNDPKRYGKIAHELSNYSPQLCAFQEVIACDSIPDTSKQIATELASYTGKSYHTHFEYCHLFMDKYPEGIAVASTAKMKQKSKIDLNHNLPGGVFPLLERYAVATTVSIHEHKLLFVCLHLDHPLKSQIQRSQSEKLLSEIERLYLQDSEVAYDGVILAGDFNSKEDSEAIHFWKDQGFCDPFTEVETKISAGKLQNRIDYILYRGNFTTRQAQFILEKGNLSDHIGMFVVLE